MVKIEITHLECTKCGYVWIPKGEEVFYCPVCKCSLEKYPPKKIKTPKPKGKAEG